MIDMKAQYKKLIDRIADFNKKKMAKLQKDFNNSMNMVIKTPPHCMNFPNQQDINKPFSDQVV
jgi:hypothetical protein